jgi:hypothetical protein
MGLTKRDRKGVPASRPAKSNVQTIEATSKDLKGLYALGFGMIMIGMLWALLGGSSWPIGAILFVSGLVLFIVTKIRIWWNHG